MMGELQSATVEYESPEGTASDTIDRPKRVDDWDGLQIFEQRDEVEIEHSYNEDRLLKVEYEYDFEEPSDDLADGGDGGRPDPIIEIGVIFFVGFVLGNLVMYFIQNSGGQISL